jgi:hypothetical protein
MFKEYNEMFGDHIKVRTFLIISLRRKKCLEFTQVKVRFECAIREVMNGDLMNPLVRLSLHSL